MYIIVATHKKVDYCKYLPKEYHLVLGGSDYKKCKVNYQKDNDGENISSKNYCYSELTALYWLWKNNNDDIIGLTHYRRFIKSKSLYLSGAYVDFNKGKKYSFNNSILKEKEILKLLKNNEIILPNKLTLNNTVEEQLLKYCYQNDVKILENIIKNDYSEYYYSYKDIMKSNNAHYFNMFIGKRNILEKYFEWLFSVLKKCEEQCDISSYDTQHKRIYGYFSEVLFNVWIAKNNIKYVERKTIFLTDNKKHAFKQFLGNLIKW